MVNRLAGHVGWISGIVFVILFIPSYLSAPDTPLATSSNQDVISFMTSQPGEVLTLNGVLLVFAGFFFLFFLGALHRALQRDEVTSSGFPSTALVGGAIFPSTHARRRCNRDHASGRRDAFSKLSAGCSARLPVDGAIRLDVPFCIRWHGRDDRRNIV
jgi:hypothetical protein